MTITTLRFTMRGMMIAVAIAAIGCASVPFLLVDPVSTLVVAALIAAIPAVALRGRNKAILAGALSLACLAGLAATVDESLSLWRDAGLHRRLANRHALRRDIISNNFSYVDRLCKAASGPALDRYKDIQGQMVIFSEHDARMFARYDRAARRPWVRVEPEPEPERPPPSSLDGLFILQNVR